MRAASGSLQFRWERAPHLPSWSEAGALREPGHAGGPLTGPRVTGPQEPPLPAPAQDG